MTSSLQKFNHTFTTIGKYTVTLRIAQGTISTTETTSLTVVPASPPVTVRRDGDEKRRAACRRDVQGEWCVVGANDVTIDLNGYTLSGNKTGIGVSMTTFPDTRIRNGTITGFATGDFQHHGSSGEPQRRRLSSATQPPSFAGHTGAGGSGPIAMKGGEIRGSTYDIVGFDKKASLGGAAVSSLRHRLSAASCSWARSSASALKVRSRDQSLTTSL